MSSSAHLCLVSINLGAITGYGRPVLLFLDGMPRARVMAAYVRDGYGAFRQPKFECDC